MQMMGLFFSKIKKSAMNYLPHSECEANRVNSRQEIQVAKSSELNPKEINGQWADDLPIDFTTQKPIMDCARVYWQKTGLCSPLTNLYVAYQIGLAPDKSAFRGSSEDIYRNVEVQLMKNIKISTPEELEIVSLVESGLPYQSYSIPTILLGTTLHYNWSLRYQEHSMISFPTKLDRYGKQNYHIIAFGRDRGHAGNCYFFDANIGEIRGDCGEVMNAFKLSLQHKSVTQRLPARIYTVKKKETIPYECLSQSKVNQDDESLSLAQGFHCSV